MTGLATRLWRTIKLFRLEQPLALFSTVPALICLTLLGVAGGLIWADTALRLDLKLPPHIVPPAETARAVFTTLAGAAMTTLTLAYSLTLVVFTLAASTIGPRLLQRFTSEPIIQMTAGVLGGAFLYALAGAFVVMPGFVPVLTLSGAGLLAIIAVGQLISFVHAAARNVNIDNEIAEIGDSLNNAISELMENAASEPRQAPDGAPLESLAAEKDGYVGWIDEAALVDFARENAIALRIALPPGKFVLQGAPLVEVHGDGPAAGLSEQGRADIRAAIRINPARGQDRNVEFSINLFVEIGLRALSPGINDTFTAISCVDRLSSALRRPVATNLDARFRCDDNGVVRLMIPGLSVSDLIRTAFSPFRRAAADNILMASHLAETLARLDTIAHAEVRPFLKEQARLLAEAVARKDPQSTDADIVSRRLGSLNED